MKKWREAILYGTGVLIAVGASYTAWQIAQKANDLRAAVSQANFTLTRMEAALSSDRHLLANDKSALRFVRQLFPPTPTDAALIRRMTAPLSRDGLALQSMAIGKSTVTDATPVPLVAYTITLTLTDGTTTSRQAFVKTLEYQTGLTNLTSLSSSDQGMTVTGVWYLYIATHTLRRTWL